MTEASRYLLGELMTLAGLIGATIEYCEIMKRRTIQRRLAAEQSVAQAAGLQGLVRVFLAER
jgi:hypothetical protein